MYCLLKPSGSDCQRLLSHSPEKYVSSTVFLLYFYFRVNIISESLVVVAAMVTNN